MDLKKIIRFKIGSEDWEMPMGIVFLMLAILLIMVLGAVYIGYSFGKNAF